jgi:ankyrin repeat protein
LNLLTAIKKNRNPYVVIVETNKNFYIISILIESGYDPSMYNNAALRAACYYGSYECVKLLLNDQCVDINNYDEDNNKSMASIVLAMNERHINIVLLLLNDSRIDIFCRGQSHRDWRSVLLTLNCGITNL